MESKNVSTWTFEEKCIEESESFIDFCKSKKDVKLARNHSKQATLIW